MLRPTAWTPVPTHSGEQFRRSSSHDDSIPTPGGAFIVRVNTRTIVNMVHISNVRHRGRFRAATSFAVVVLMSPLFTGTSATASGIKVRRAATVDLVGHGWGAGIGLGQWGAFGYAVRYHFGYERILNRYYGATTSATLSAIGHASDPSSACSFWRISTSRRTSVTTLS